MQRVPSALLIAVTGVFCVTLEQVPTFLVEINSTMVAGSGSKGASRDAGSAAAGDAPQIMVSLRNNTLFV
jgi:hypothetical protein